MDSRILIVDDQQSNVRLLEHTLRRGGFASITSTTDSRAVTALHRDHHYDLILLDLVMPGMDGFQVMEGLAEIEEGGDLPVLVMSADPRHEVRALQAGARGFMNKPFVLTEVVTCVSSLLGKKRIAAI
ncbi:MAG TPA: response regulator [Thermoanaerobaculia bacterium]|jgi:CheY-like chemotaxis protein|nr:response regulator [Thermoanaerobaculia bacterium]